MHPLSLPQQSIYLDSLLHGPTTKYNMGGAIEIRGPLDAARFAQALDAARAVHDVQRLRIQPEGETAMQEFLPEEACPGTLATFDFSDRPEPLLAAKDWLLADIRRPMPLDRFPLHGDVLFRVGDDLHLWYPKFHHAAYDAYGHSLITATAAEAYNQLLRLGRLPAFERHSYVDFLQDDAAYAASAQYQLDAAFWRGKFPAMPPPLPFTARKGELTGDVLRTARHALTIPRPVYHSLLGRAEEAGVTPFQLLLACLFAYLNRLTGCADIVIGTPILNRGNHAFRRTAGMFMNMMPLRLEIGGGASVAGLARALKAEARACYRHQRFPLGETLRHCRAVDGFCQGIFDVTMVYRKLDYGVTFGGSPLRVETLDTGARQETLSLEIDEYNQDEDVNLFFNYNSQLISAPEAAQMAQAFELLLTDVATEGDRPVREIRLCPESASSATPRRAAPGQTVVELLERRAAEAPDAVAIVCGEDRMTRGELARASDRIAAFLQDAGGATPEQSVAVLCDRNIEWIAAMLGVLKAGCAYLPLGPDVPRERLLYILRDSACRLLLAGSRHRKETFERVRCIPVCEASLPRPPKARVALSPSSLAYIIYTSGTTGEPKGVLIEHGSLANTTGELVRDWEITARDRILGFSGAMFDASIVDVFLALTSGAPLVIAPTDSILDPLLFLDIIRREGVTVATLPPAYLSALGPVDLTPLRVLITAGEAANPADVAHHVRQLTYVNAYGPTEAAVCASYFKLGAGTVFAAGRVPIGKAIGGTEIRILDEDLRPLPLGVAGELCMAGAGLARGYLNRAELTAALFVTNPFREGERLYRSGDLGRQLPDGNIEFLGRRDTQVKIRGYRVEPGEIEAALKTHPAVETAVVAAWASVGALELVAYVVPRAEFDAPALRRHLASKLPAYMLPSRWIRLAAAPLTASGKVDRSALPNPAAGENIAHSRGSRNPQTPLEKALAGIWEEVLEVAGVGVDGDFFELGGHSLKAVLVLSRVRRRIGASVELPDFFASPTVAGLAALIGHSPPSREAPIPVAAPMDLYPLSNAQSRIWVLAQMEGGLAAYNIPLALELQGPLDEAALERSFRSLIARHESLRTCFVDSAGIPQQKILSAADPVFELGRYDLSGDAPAPDAVRLRLQAECARPFDLRHAPLLRASVFRLAEQRRLLCLTIHHIVADGWSCDVLLRELSALYAGSTGGPAPSLPALRIQYRDYSQWLAACLNEKPLLADREFWMHKLAPPLPVLNLPADYPRPATLGFAGAIERFPLPCASDLSLARFCAQRNVSPFMTLLAAVFGLLHRYSGDDDIVIGTPSANRERIDLENQVGLYLNTLALRLRIGSETTLPGLLNGVRTAVLEAQEHQGYPFDSLVQSLKLRRGTDRNPVFDVMVLMRDAVGPRFLAPGVRCTEYTAAPDVSVFDLTFHFSSSGAGVTLDLEYNTALFERPRMERMSKHLDRLIEALVANPDAKVRDVDLLPDEERRQLGEFSEGPSLPAPSRTVVASFAAQARRTPDRTAVVFENRRLSYAELAAAAGALAGRIERAGVAPGSVVALLAGRSEWMVAGVAGIMASGAACLAIDPAEPRERMLGMLEESNCQAVVSDGTRTAWDGPPAIALRDDADSTRAPLPACAQLEGVAYVTYTSGSTGTPKGSSIEHRSLANLVNALGACLYDSLPQPATELMLTSIAFDVAIKQIFGALTRGNTLMVAGDEPRRDPAALMAEIARGGIHLIDITPAHFSVLLAQGFARMPKPDLCAIVLGSEPLPSLLVEEFAADAANRHIALHNFYGPSECAVEALHCRLDGRALLSRIAPLGRPIANSRVYVLAPGDDLAPIGVPGEICLGGIPVGRGYVNRPELTAARFVRDPFREGERIYRTGDVGRWTAGGVLEYLGREDGQLKIRGYRVERGEVEYHLLRHPRVSQAVVEGRLAPDGTTQLVAYLVANDPAPPAAEFRAFLRTRLPDYMLPAAFVTVPALPITPNGKIDRNALPDPDGRNGDGCYLPPRDALERQLVQLWEALLTVHPVGIEDSFFEIGGHSLLAVRLASEIDRCFGTRLPLARLFEFPTISGIAPLLRKNGKLPEPSCLVRIRPRGARPPLFFLPGAEGTVGYLYRLARQLDPETPFFAFQARGLTPESSPHTSIEEMAAHYVALLCEVQPQGPYCLAGYSFGGQVAYAMAQILLERGQEIALLAVIDALAPGAPVAGDAPLDVEDLMDPGDAECLRRVFRANLENLARYSPESTLPLPIALFRSSESIEREHPELNLGEDLGWGRYASQAVPVHRLPGTHVTMMRSPHIEKLAEMLSNVLSARPRPAHSTIARKSGV